LGSAVGALDPEFGEEHCVDEAGSLYVALVRGAKAKPSAAAAAGATVFERFEAMVSACPDELAYENGPLSLSYSKLAGKARAARSRILALGPPEPGIVGILTADRVNALAAIFGAAGSGHAYVLLDVNDPDKRLAKIAGEAHPFAVLADEALLGRAASLAAKPDAAIDLDHLGDGDDEHAPLPTSPDSLLYVSFTSGSTGVPKGVCQTHRNLIFYVDAYIEAMEIKAGDPISWLFAHGASASNMDIYGALLTGARLCAFEVKDASFAAMARWIDESGITLLHTVPTVVRELADAVTRDKVFDSVSVVDLAGEMLFANDVARMRPHFRPDCRILNRLAATEASFIASLEVTEAHEKAEGALPVGKPLAGIEVAILRDDGGDAERGETGAIAIDSPHVCTGYLNRPDLDAEAFSDVAGRIGWRRYRSADLGFIDDAGNLNFIGRSGSRIKLRGQAVDLAEVEAALYECPGVTGAAVLPRSGEGEEAREILAYLTLSPGTAREAGEIRKQLAEALPAYMLPSGFVFLDSFPYTATSKVDRQALAELDLDKVRFRPGYMPPENEVEAKLASIFSEVLNVPAVGRLDDFFLLGGDSLSLVNLQILATETFGRQLSELHQDASVEGIAKWLGGVAGDAEIHAPVLLPIRTEGSAPPLFVVHGRRGQAHVGPHFLELLGQDQPVYALQARGLDGNLEPHRTVEAMAAEYVAAIKTVQPRGPYFLGGFCAGCYVALEMLRLIYREGEEFYAPLLIDPPPPKFQRTGEVVADEILLMQMEKRVKSGLWKVDLHNASAVRAALEVARAIDDALEAYKPKRIFPTRAMVIATAARWLRRFNVKRIFGPNVRVILVEGNHRDMLSTDNEQFADAVRKCIAHTQRIAELYRDKLADKGGGMAASQPNKRKRASAGREPA
jgi:amino acid adenylation domain-containing protein